MMWCSDPVVQAARKHAGWAEFHRAAGKIGIYFDRIEQQGRRGQYGAVAYTLADRVPMKLADGRGATPIDAVVDGYRAAGRVSAEVDQWVAVLVGDGDPFADLLGGVETVSFEDLLGD